MSASANRIAPPHPVAIIRQAVLAQRAAGVHVRIGSLGVHCLSAEPPRWERDHRQNGVDPLGCVLLEVQPADGDDAHAALAVIFDVSVAYVDGLADGIQKAEVDKERAGKLGAKLYVTGWEQGYRFREEFLRAGFSS